MTKTFIRAAFASALLATAATPAFAAEVEGSVEVTADVTSNCIVSSEGIDFGPVNVTSGLADNAGGVIAVTCTSGTAWTAAADVGIGSGATVYNRKMSDGTNLMNYGLYTNPERSSVWGDGVEANTFVLSGTGTGVSVGKTFYGSIPGNQPSLPAGSYADTVTVTLTY